MIIREQYLDKLRLFREKQLIKVITGIRRCGKSTLLDLFIDELQADGVSDSQIIHINFEDLKNEHLLDYKKTYDYIFERLNKSGYTYIFLDEVQRVKDFQKAVDSLYIQKNVDLYITGSNSDLLSSELATLLTGRYVEIKMLPLSFKEYAASFGGKVSNRDLFNRYLRNGAMPYILNLENNEAIDIYLSGIYHTILTNGIARRHPQVDIAVLESILKYLMHNIGNLVSSVNISNTLTSNNRKTSYNTVEKYIGYLTESFLIYEASRYDVKGKQHLKSLSKFYAVDSGIRTMLLANSASDIGHILENVVYLELLRRGFKVNVGKLDNREVDFVAENSSGTLYFQVAATVLDSEKLRTELEPLERIGDNYPKTLITLDEFNLGNSNGIQIVNAIDFLLDV
ncbi:MAG: ATP-binding protein [Clostridia bacterium]